MAPSTASQTFRALVFGASGITGWGIANAALSYPTIDTFDQVIALTNRPLKTEDALFPADDRLRMYSGVDLTGGVDSVAKSLASIEGFEGVTHVYFSAYTSHGSDYLERKHANVTILENAVKAVEKLCSNFVYLSFQAGGKTYGLEFADKLGLDAPFKESQPRVPSPYDENIFYYAQVDLLKDLSRGKKWVFSEIRPDAIEGFAPANSPMNIAQNLGLFLSLYASIEGKGTVVSYPGSEKAYRALHTDCGQDVLARFTIFVSLQDRSRVSQEAFNIGDGTPVSWEQVWPGICSYFGLEGVGPNTSGRLTGAEWIFAHKDQWSKWTKKNGLREGFLEGTSWDFIDFLLNQADRNRHFDLSKAEQFGFKEKVDTVRSYEIAFGRMKQARMIP